MGEGEEECDQKQESDEKQLIAALRALAEQIEGLGWCIIIAALLIGGGLYLNGCLQFSMPH